MKKMNLDLSQPQYVPAGRILYKMYYSGFLEKTLDRAERSGFPHNGGQHTLRLHMPEADILAFLDLVKETFALYVKEVEAFIESAHERIQKQKVGAATAH